MSAYLVSDNVMHDVVAQILELARHQYIEYEFDTKRQVTAADADLLGSALLAMNHLALEARYDDEPPQSVDYTFKAGQASQNLMQRYTSMRCLLYQCSEGDVPQTRLYLFLERLIGATAGNIVCELPAYDRATWGRG